jgi:hypothetical protein
MRFRKRPVEIDAVQWTGDNLDQVMQFCEGNATYELMARGNSELVIATLEDGQDKIAQHIASRNDWIIRGVQGEYYACKPDIFEQTYEPIEPLKPNSGIYQVAAKEMEPLFQAFIHNVPELFDGHQDGFHQVKRDHTGIYVKNPPYSPKSAK